MPALLSSFGTKKSFLNLPPVSVSGTFDYSSSKDKEVFKKKCVFVLCKECQVSPSLGCWGFFFVIQMVYQDSEGENMGKGSVSCL